MFDNKVLMITGGTGSLGHALTKKLLELGAKKARQVAEKVLDRVRSASGVNYS